MEKVGLAEVGRRLFLEVCPGKSHSAADTSTKQRRRATRAVELDPVNKIATHESSAFSRSAVSIRSNIQKSVHTV